MPKLSIITINYNNAEGLKKTIESVIAQRYSDLEYLIIDGGSTDDSTEIIKRYSDKITYSVSEKDSGIYNAQNKGIEKAKGEYCLFLNSGDYLANKDVLAKVFALNSNADIIYGDMIIDHGNGKLTYGKMPEKISFYQMYSDTLWHPVSFIKRQLFEKHGSYDETFKMVADYDFFFRTIIIKNVSTQHVNENISVFDLSGLSSRPEMKQTERAERVAVLNKYFPSLVVEYFLENIHIKEKKNTLMDRIINRLK